MSRKTIPFRIPQDAARGTGAESVAAVSSPGTEADQWVSQPEGRAEDAAAEPVAAEKGARALTITISAEPDWYDAWKVAVFLPYAVACYWTLGAARIGGREGKARA
ncbi:hypothetical protein M2323_001755 [Rhodoblastus acidophilus]|uniref:hypothetical protein n=1 Tax=Rhodoblastus acidophilus TaxID=1074 RepID=UPI002224191E|nr:hypothetical protein [Rhodoblastus acidophilus]MCW2283813.1 hypothetical protein [Rhodoblastus acidophilus]MCW2332838.1 hypothetical protein [Rhodoblastus acidophilus]